MELGARLAMGLESVRQRELDGWVAAHLQPSPEFSTAVRQTVKDICDFLKERCFEGIRVLKTVKGGSAGKGTALRNNSDADVVLFVNCFSSYQEQEEQRGRILAIIERRLYECPPASSSVRISTPCYKDSRDRPRSLSLTLSSYTSGESIDVDILPAYDVLGQVIEDARPHPEVYVKLLATCCGPGDFSPSFTELQKNFVKWRPAKLKDLVRLVKHWYKQVLKPQYPNAKLPPKYALELLTIYAWEEGTDREDFSMAEGFCTVLELLGRYQDICIYWEKYYSLQDERIGAYLKKQLCQPRPVILDPADPTGILGQDKSWDLVAKEAARSRHSLPCVNATRSWDVQPARSVTVQVKQLQGISLSRKVRPSTQVWELKREIEKEWGIPCYQQRLALQQNFSNCPSVLQDGDSLATHGLFYDVTLLLLHTEPQQMDVLVKDSNNKTTVYTVRPSDTVRQLKQQICARQGLAVEQQRLTYETRELENNHRLEHYGVQPHSTIYLLLRLRGGAGLLPRWFVPS
ncbi:2'-5'-oligoadenylate synthase 1-like [Lagopus leucura]|uniref:2'-5'-oligoadenylate synthase 1-like n=1 Tax=Lagopus leucura TaxID=30410 RepID=UPI001C6678E0|nr:2'-5'-oligoadenylate synthase 1-like [Lagopus leucura]